MAESSLSMQYSDLTSEVGNLLGYGRGLQAGENAWTKYQQSNIDSCVKSGLRTFYYPPAMEGMESGYSWSFMHPVATMQLDSGLDKMPLPDDFGGMEGQITVQQQGAQGNQFWPVNFVGIGQVYAQKTMLPTQTGRPLIACEEPLKQTTPSTGQRFQLRVWPKADTNYILQFAYYVNPDYINGTLPFPMGGMIHAETILEACLMVAEQRLDDDSRVHAMKFQERLQASISADRRLKAQTLGPNIDRSDALYSGWGRGYPWAHYNDQIFVNGVLY